MFFTKVAFVVAVRLHRFKPDFSEKSEMLYQEFKHEVLFTHASYYPGKEQLNTSPKTTIN